MKQDTPCKKIELNGEPLVPLKANELRIGNWVIMKMLDGTHVLTTVPAVGIAMVESGKCEVFGVALTEDILVKCGFEKHHSGVDYFYYTTIGLPSIQVIIDGYSSINKTKINVHLKYLHQLENTWVVVFGDELKCEL